MKTFGNFIILSGIRGSGKTTFRKTKYGDFICYSSSELGGDKKLQHITNFRNFAENFVNGTDAFLKHNFILDNSNLSSDDFSPYYMLAKSFGFNIHLITINCHIDTILTRAEKAGKLYHRYHLETQWDKLLNRRIPSWMEITERQVNNNWEKDESYV